MVEYLRRHPKALAVEQVPLNHSIIGLLAADRQHPSIHRLGG